ncbi:MAG TPA: HAD family hydrolase [candidate division Zixibacteria bacterium]|nr:HAD family hydrolase [candidate division Zixibacteria bacterium]
MTPRLVSFDVYGTLVDVRAGSRAAFEAILAACGGRGVDPLEFWEHWEAGNIRRYREPYRSYREICRHSLAESFARFGLRGNPGEIDRYFSAFPSFSRFAEVDEVLERLGRRYPLAIVSNIDDELLAVTPLGRRFDLVCTAEGARGYKPDGTLFRHLLEKSGVEPGDLLHCGQSQYTDLVGAKPLGIKVAWINRRGLTLGPGVPAPDFEYRDLRPLAELIL